MCFYFLWLWISFMRHYESHHPGESLITWLRYSLREWMEHRTMACAVPLTAGQAIALPINKSTLWPLRLGCRRRPFHKAGSPWSSDQGQCKIVCLKTQNCAARDFGRYALIPGSRWSIFFKSALGFKIINFSGGMSCVRVQSICFQTVSACSVILLVSPPVSMHPELTSFMLTLWPNAKKLQLWG